MCPKGPNYRECRECREFRKCGIRPMPVERANRTVRSSLVSSIYASHDIHDIHGSPSGNVNFPTSRCLTIRRLTRKRKRAGQIPVAPVESAVKRNHHQQIDEPFVVEALLGES